MTPNPVTKRFKIRIEVEAEVAPETWEEAQERIRIRFSDGEEALKEGHDWYLEQHQMCAEFLQAVMADDELLDQLVRLYVLQDLRDGWFTSLFETKERTEDFLSSVLDQVTPQARAHFEEATDKDLFYEYFEDFYKAFSENVTFAGVFGLD